MPLVPSAKRCLATLVSAKGNVQPRDFSIFPDFFTIPEQRLLLATALQKLDSMESRQSRRRRKVFEQSPRPSEHSSHVQSLFCPDNLYAFEAGHYDGVIHQFRELHLSSWPDVPGLLVLLERLRSLHPVGETQTHLLHLASSGEILPHVDNPSASGSWILGISLGAERVMHMEGSDDKEDSFDVLLPSGSVYLQKDSVRFGYKHSILRNGTFRGRRIEDGQRLSIMIRDRLPVAAALQPIKTSSVQGDHS